jgi:hypothetical protein
MSAQEIRICIDEISSEIALQKKLLQMLEGWNMIEAFSSASSILSWIQSHASP